MNINKLLFITIMLAGTLSADPLMAQDMPPEKPEQISERPDRMQPLMDKMKELGVTPEQQQQMKAAHDESEQKQKALREELRVKNTALKNELDSDTPNRAKADAIAGEINDLRSRMMTHHLDQLFKIRSTLTPEQFHSLEQMRKNDRNERKENRRPKGMRDRDEPDNK